MNSWAININFLNCVIWYVINSSGVMCAIFTPIPVNVFGVASCMFFAWSGLFNHAVMILFKIAVFIFVLLGIVM